MGKCLKSFLRFPGFETYVPHEKEEEHIEDVITESEINAFTEKRNEIQRKTKKTNGERNGKTKARKNKEFEIELQ